jgi:hypothetical protein
MSLTVDGGRQCFQTLVLWPEQRGRVEIAECDHVVGVFFSVSASLERPLIAAAMSA